MSKKRTSPKKHNSAVALLNEPIDQVVTPWLLVALIVIMAIFVVLQYTLA